MAGFTCKEANFIIDVRVAFPSFTAFMHCSPCFPTTPLVLLALGVFPKSSERFHTLVTLATNFWSDLFVIGQSSEWHSLKRSRNRAIFFMWGRLWLCPCLLFSRLLGNHWTCGLSGVGPSVFITTNANTNRKITEHA